MKKTLIFLFITMLLPLTAAAEDAYAVYSVIDHSLTFYYDNFRGSRASAANTVVIDDNKSDIPGWSINYREKIKTVVFTYSFAKVRPKNTSSWFYSWSTLQKIEGIENLNTSEVTDMSYMFYKCSGLTALDLSSWNTGKVTNMSNMFYECSGLTTLDLSGWNTSNVKYMGYMFGYCSSLTTIYVNGSWNTDNVTESSLMFYGCSNLVGGKGTTYNARHSTQAYAHIDGGTSNPGYFTDKSPYAVFSGTTLTFYCDGNRNSRSGYAYDIDDYTDNGVPKWGYNHSASITKVVFDASFATARPRSTKNWFVPLQLLQQIEGIENLNTSEVTDMSGMFNYCQCLTALDLSSWNTSKVTNMNSMFSNCLSLKTLDLSGWNTSNVTDMGTMFLACASLTTIACGDGWNTDKVTASAGMFAACTKLVGGEGTTYDAAHVDKAYAHADGGIIDPGYFTMAAKKAYAVYNYGTLTFYFDNMRGGRTGDKYGVDKDVFYDCHTWSVYHSDDITKAVFDPSFSQVRLTSTDMFFYACKELQQIEGIQYLNTSKVTDMSYMFHDCEMLNNLDLSNFDTQNVTNMSELFSGCSRLTNLDLSNFNTSKVTNMYSMFRDCFRLQALDFGSFDTSNVTDMGSMFAGCYDMTTLDISRFVTSNVTDMNSMFEDCFKLTTLDVSRFDTSKVKDMSSMFWGCKGLTSLDLSNFKTSNVTDMGSMFRHCNALTTIYCGSGWIIDKVTDSDFMFEDCPNLVGGKGTTYDAAHVDKGYAHVDGGANNPGYLTLKGGRLLGDVNGDGLVNSADVQKVYALMAQNATGNIHPEADINNDGNVNSADIQKIYAIMASI